MTIHFIIEGLLIIAVLLLWFGHFCHEAALKRMEDKDDIPGQIRSLQLWREEFNSQLILLMEYLDVRITLAGRKMIKKTDKPDCNGGTGGTNT